MSSKTIQLSTRVTQEDADFLAELQIEGASTPSDKLRALIDEARRRRQGDHDYGASLRMVSELLQPALLRVRELEQTGLGHSELVALVADWVGETLAYFIAKVPDRGLERAAAHREARALETGLAERAFRLTNVLLRLGVTEHAPCYDAKLIGKELGPTLEVAALLLKVRTGRSAGAASERK
jgi:hypothetical protein